ncbi:MFS transporter [Shewanella maritima]|uniref:MFS transporter n=1 Tax=Shewanella maritima TaxID=2520507 RepID=A0A411PKD9_9GAMM|nr:MFS transporter [Shewanella maritima]QBF83986.1 MFS transporter [Shewanella maritima]
MAGATTPSQSINPKRLTWALCLASVVIYINLYTLQGMLPLIAEHFDVTGANATLILSVTSFSLAFSLLMYAVLSDRVGRLLPMVVSLWALVLSNLLLICANEFETLMLVRLVQGVLLAAVPAIAMAYFKEQLPAEFMLKAAAVYIMANSFGGISGRIFGGLMAQHLDWQQSMILMFTVTLIGVAVVTYLLPRCEVKPEKQQLPIIEKMRYDLKGFVLHLSDSQMRLVYLIGGLAFMMMVNQFSFIQLHLMESPYSLSRFAATLIFLCYLSGSVSSYSSARLIMKYGTTKLFKLALALMLIGSLITLHDTLLWIVVGFLVTASGFFLAHSCCNSFVAVRATAHRAKATSLYLCSYYLGAALGGPYLMVFWQQNKWDGVVLGSMVLIALMLVAIARITYLERLVKAQSS